MPGFDPDAKPKDQEAPQQSVKGEAVNAADLSDFDDVAVEAAKNIDQDEINNIPVPDGKYQVQIVKTDVKNDFDDDGYKTLKMLWVMTIKAPRSVNRRLFKTSRLRTHPDFKASSMEHFLKDLLRCRLDMSGKFGEAFMRERPKLNGVWLEVNVQNGKFTGSDGIERPSQSVWINRRVEPIAVPSTNFVPGQPGVGDQSTPPPAAPQESVDKAFFGDLDVPAAHGPTGSPASDGEPAADDELVPF